jgi:gamma-glutamylcyclotransferase (GGCT)/AIG2-like uncharacterized protein YtfP
MRNKFYMFAYGANTNAHSMKYRVGQHAIPIGKAILPGHEFRFARHADVIPCRGKNVDGVLWEIDHDGLDLIDTFEGYPNYYSRKMANVVCDGNEYNAIVYFMAPGNPICGPTQYYIDTIVEGYADFKIPLDQVHNALLEVEQCAKCFVFDTWADMIKCVFGVEALKMFEEESEDLGEPLNVICQEYIEYCVGQGEIDFKFSVKEHEEV